MAQITRHLTVREGTSQNLTLNDSNSYKVKTVLHDNIIHPNYKGIVRCGTWRQLARCHAQSVAAEVYFGSQIWWQILNLETQIPTPVS